MVPEWVLHGLGMFSEAYVLFSVGNVKGLFKAEYPECWKTKDECPSALLESITYTEITGVIIGMLTMGFVADLMGRRFGSRLTATVMFIGAIMLAASTGKGAEGEFVMFTVALGLFGYGVGGEYPLASASAAERAEEAKRPGEVQSRGKQVVLVFSMQGLGNVFNTLIIVVLLAMFGQTGKDETLEKSKLDAVWRIQYFVAVLVLGGLMAYRYFVLAESAVWSKTRSSSAGNVVDTTAPSLELGCISTAPAAGSSPGTYAAEDGAGMPVLSVEVGVPADSHRAAVLSPSTLSPGSAIGLMSPHPPPSSTGRSKLLRIATLVYHHWDRLLGTGIGWFVWDFTFYGSKLFQGRFISILYGNPPLYTILKWTLLNSFIALLGYYAAAFTIDKPWMGRWRMQCMGFFVVALTFTCCGIWFDDLQKDDNIHVFQFLYYASSFFGQWGPNATTWLLPSEMYPTDVRAVAHGISAALGKLGALLAGIVFYFMSDKSIFLFSGVSGIIGLVVTVLFIADATTLDLSDLDRRWDYVTSGRSHEYAGEAVRREYLSLYEYWRGDGDSRGGGRLLRHDTILSPNLSTISDDEGTTI